MYLNFTEIEFKPDDFFDAEGALLANIAAHTNRLNDLLARARQNDISLGVMITEQCKRDPEGDDMILWESVTIIRTLVVAK